MGEDAMLIAGYEMYELLQKPRNAPAPRAALAPAGKWSSVFMGFWRLGDKLGTEMVASQKYLSIQITRKTTSLLFGLHFATSTLNGIIAAMISENGTAGPSNAYTVSSDG
jgi:hypothetical protein